MVHDNTQKRSPLAQWYNTTRSATNAQLFQKFV